MRSKRSVFLAAAGMVLAVSPVDAVNREVKPADYAAIEKRNPFGLVDPPKPKPIVVPPEPVAKEPPPNVELTGMFHDSVKNKTYALFLMEKKGESKKRSYMLSEGENQDGLRVVQIDRKTANVKINLKGEDSTITYTEPKAAAVGKPRPGLAMGGGNPALRQPRADAAANRNGGAPQNGTPPNFSFSTPRSGGRVAGGMQGAQTGVAGGASLRPIPQRPVRTTETLTRDEQEILIEAQRAKRQLELQQNPSAVPPMPPLPPTSLTTPEDYRRIVVPPPVPDGN